jgi:hypothetical protein
MGVSAWCLTEYRIIFGILTAVIVVLVGIEMVKK